MRKLLILIALTLALAALVVWRYSSARPKQTWTTDSPAALEEFQKALEARMKLYHGDGAEHSRRALELDPDFAAAKVFRLHYVYGAERARLMKELTSLDLGRLSPREALMVSFNLAQRRKDSQEARSLAKDYLKKHPKDPYGLMYLCEAQEDPIEQEACYRKLIAVEPNFVLAQNFLGYLAMGQGEFQEAEERFRTYQYIAPGQANPHDSMGELLLLLGRYDEARLELEKALSLRPDFEASYTSLLRAALLEERVEEAQATLKRGEEAGLRREWQQCMGCEILLQQLSASDEWETIWQATDACRRVYCADLGLGIFSRHRAALATGRQEEAREMEEDIARRSEERGERSHYGSRLLAATRNHLRAVRWKFEGRQEEALEAFQRADEELAYSGFRDGFLKLQNRLALAQALREAGRAEEAAALEEAVASVNPDFLRESIRFRSPPQAAP